MASIIRWLSRVASRLCCGSKCTGKNDSEEVLNEGGSLSSEKEQPSGIGKISHDETGELQVKIEEDAHVIEEGVGTSCRDDTATCDDPSTVCEGNATRNLDPTTVCSTAAVNEKTVEDSPLQTMEILPQLEICHPSKNWSENKISEQAPNGSDAYVCIEGREFCVHSDIIRQKSTFFQQKLEGREGLQTVIFLPSECLSSESFELLLEFMYR